MYLDELLDGIIPYLTRGKAVIPTIKRERIKGQLRAFAERDEAIKKLIDMSGERYTYQAKDHNYLGYRLHEHLDFIMKR